MSRPNLKCAQDDCERRAVRTRDGQRWCVWHPEQTAPPLVAGVTVERRPEPAKDKPRPSTANISSIRSVSVEEPDKPEPEAPAEQPAEPPLIVETPAPNLYIEPTPAARSTPADRCLLNRGDQHPNPKVRRLASDARRTLEQLASALAHHDRRSA